MFKSFTKLVAIIAIAVSATGCAINQHQQAGSGTAEFGIVLQAQKASVASRGQEVGFSALGGIIGTAIGGMATKDKSWSTRATAMSIGGTIGGMAGNVAAKASGITEGQALIVLNGNLQKMSITQPNLNGEVLKAGDAVYILRENSGVRATRIQPGDPLGAAFVAGLQGLPTNWK
ncbi:hypothetical protein DZC30_18700 [Comamonas testosteroni]|uniref:Glycine zipper 2TM domain-containing protein n=1 Tax=Comamonas testosteroni TaxID=285 RepID=A0A373FD57_COMTE|nr:hypothetical protein [Comamonas testosteroni]RGE41339.1 hypothetical protein DZC30_18700 [Comamonas testosteroni]